jgi:hypothetical protein
MIQCHKHTAQNIKQKMLNQKRFETLESTAIAVTPMTNATAATPIGRGGIIIDLSLNIHDTNSRYATSILHIRQLHPLLTVQLNQIQTARIQHFFYKLG